MMEYLIGLEYKQKIMKKELKKLKSSKLKSLE